MIATDTVFVLGAGASMPYGFPLGSALLDAIRSEMLRKDESQLRNDIERCGFNSKALRDFGVALGESGLYSIDEFVQWYPEHRQLAKLSIARVLVPCEMDERLHSHADGRGWLPAGQPDPRWYRYFFSQLLTSREGRCTLGNNRVAFITFNFDRSFERAFFSFVMANCAKNPRAAMLAMQDTPIYHLHGQLGAPAWIESDGYVREYRPDDTGVAALRMCAEAIRIVDEEVSDSTTLKLALDRLRQAERIVFLGFGYSGLNVHKLQIENLKANAKLFGTSYRMLRGPVAAAHTMFADRHIDIAPSGQDILTFLGDTSLIYE